MIITAIKIIIAIAICIYASIEDIRLGIISNRVLLPATLSGLVLNVLEWLNDRDVLRMQVICISVVILISLLLYFTHIWAGGDCKMMITLAILLPVSLYDNQIVGIPLLTVMIGSFGASYIYLIIDSIVCFLKKKNSERDYKQVKDAVLRSLFNWIVCVIYINIVHSILTLVNVTVIQRSTFVMITLNVCIALIITKIEALKNRYILWLVAILSVVLFLCANNYTLDLKRIISFLVIIIAIVLREFIDNYNYATIDTDSLKRGMILALTTTIMFANSKVRGLPEQSTEDLRSRLTDEEVEAVKRWGKTKNISQLVIVRKIPFAIFLSIGTLLFLFLGCRSW